MTFVFSVLALAVATAMAVRTLNSPTSANIVLTVLFVICAIASFAYSAAYSIIVRLHRNRIEYRLFSEAISLQVKSRATGNDDDSDYIREQLNSKAQSLREAIEGVQAVYKILEWKNPSDSDDDKAGQATGRRGG